MHFLNSILRYYLSIYGRYNNLEINYANELANKNMRSSFQRFQIHYKEHSALMFNDKLYISKSLFIKLI